MFKNIIGDEKRLLPILCKCGCGNYAKVGNIYIIGHTARGKKGISHIGINNPMWGKHHSQKTKEDSSKRMMGNKCALGKLSPHLALLNKSRVGIPIKEESKEKQRQSILAYWNSEEGRQQKLIHSAKQVKFAKNNPKIKLYAAKLGHKSCPRISSLEKRVDDILRKANIKFIAQFEYDLGFVDFLVYPDVALFVNGNYWHNYPYGTEKDKRQLEFLKSQGYKTLIIWESDLKKETKESLIERIRCFNGN